MQRMAGGCCTSTESYPLYGTFMAKLSNCIFAWDPEDYALLLAAKKGELHESGEYTVSACCTASE